MKKFFIELQETTTKVRSAQFIVEADPGEDLYKKIDDLVFDEGEEVEETSFICEVEITKTVEKS